MTLESVQVRSFGASGAAPTSIRSLRSWTKEDGDATCASASTRRPRSSFITRFRNRTENLTPGLSAPTLQSNLSVGPGIRSELEGGFLQTVCRERRPFWNREQLRGYRLMPRATSLMYTSEIKKLPNFFLTMLSLIKLMIFIYVSDIQRGRNRPPPRGRCQFPGGRFLQDRIYKISELIP